MTTRLPQVGERWLLRPRPSPEWACAGCGRVVTVYAGDCVVTVVEAPVKGQWLCSGCGLWEDVPPGVVSTNLPGTHSSRVVAVPIAWLEPLEAENSALRGEDPR